MDVQQPVAPIQQGIGKGVLILLCRTWVEGKMTCYNGCNCLPPDLTVCLGGARRLLLRIGA
eukprot:6456230-Amphidinium_carterae.1